ncbi:MAG: hypothetical protein JNM00_09240, partial [Flavobacteriales bacterium]|nr:hypothetical protein [Flavobacteriales bacterium]
MRKVSIVVFACFTICFQVSAQCEQHMVQFHCYNSLGASLFIRDAADVVLIDTTIAAYTVANNFILELDLEAGCYTIQLTNDVNFTTYFYGVDSNGTAQYT